jgi:hypothetical protein
MPNNRANINDVEILRAPQVLDKGIPLPGLDGRFEVHEGWVSIITEGGAFKEILGPGTHFLSKYHFWRNVRQTQVNVMINTLPVVSTREFSISQPTMIEINLELAVEYRVSDPRRVAMEVSHPLTSLWDRVHMAVGNVVAQCTHDELRTRGEGISRITLQRLQGMQLPATLGMEVFNVFVTTLKATDAGADVLAGQNLREYQRTQEWVEEARRLAQSQMTPQWLLMHRPDLVQQMLAGNQEIMKVFIEKGGWDPSRVLQQFAASSPLGSMGFGGMGGLSPGAGIGLDSGSQFPAVSPPPNPVPQIGPGAQAGTDVLARIREEAELLRQVPGSRVEARAGEQLDGLPDGTYGIRATLPRPSGGELTVTFSCRPGFPTNPPGVEVKVDGEPQAFNPVALRQWGVHRYLVEIVNEARQFFA